MAEITKELVLQSISGDASRVEGLSDAQWSHYIELLGWYFQGVSVPDGWQFMIESSMQQHGATPDQAFVLAAARHEVDKVLQP